MSPVDPTRFLGSFPIGLTRYSIPGQFDTTRQVYFGIHLINMMRTGGMVGSIPYAFNLAQLSGIGQPFQSGLVGRLFNMGNSANSRLGYNSGVVRLNDGQLHYITAGTFQNGRFSARGIRPHSEAVSEGFIASTETGRGEARARCIQELDLISIDDERLPEGVRAELRREAEARGAYIDGRPVYVRYNWEGEGDARRPTTRAFTGLYIGRRDGGIEYTGGESNTVNRAQLPPQIYYSHPTLSRRRGDSWFRVVPEPRLRTSPYIQNFNYPFPGGATGLLTRNLPGASGTYSHVLIQPDIGNRSTWRWVEIPPGGLQLNGSGNPYDSTRDGARPTIVINNNGSITLDQGASYLGDGCSRFNLVRSGTDELAGPAFHIHNRSGG